MKEIIAILENEIEAHLADYAKPGISQVEREQITATIRYKREQIGKLNRSDSVNKPESKVGTDAVNQFEPAAAHSKGDPLANPAAITQTDQKGKMWAFLTGVNQYEDSLNFPKLDYCADDAEALAKTLPKCGYADRIKLLTDKTGEPVTKAKIEMDFAAFASSNKVKPDDLLLFYYSGHGAADEQDTYLVSHSGYLKSLNKYAVKLSHILELMRQSTARKKVVILDACKSGADVRSKDSPLMSEQFIANVYDNSAGIMIFASCQKGERSYLDDSKKQSIFTHYLLEALRQRESLNEGKFLTVTDVYTRVLNDVVEWAKENHTIQTPTRWNEAIGEFILADFR
ncbi:MAG TPA: caspase family protein [Blastocatellia bacterium]|nr:caspase family protein [Blastocatellia bacterium]HMV83609.1 caspase family protein [Blastocatellia bacterium]HMX26569.1 caspase family protein [Blastocatellia bacterium]HMZ22317.1 caspase family protein [Blastocatellia bacterium]HNG28418.1 caspase family protein [Blastocatellia bacterium]